MEDGGPLLENFSRAPFGDQGAFFHVEFIEESRIPQVSSI